MMSQAYGPLNHTFFNSKTENILYREGPSTYGFQSRWGSKLLPNKRQKSSANTPKRGPAKRPKKTVQLSYAMAPKEGLRMPIVCHGYREVQMTTEKFTNTTRAVGGPVDDLPEEGFTYWVQGLPSLYARAKTAWYSRSSKYGRWRHVRGPGWIW